MNKNSQNYKSTTLVKIYWILSWPNFRLVNWVGIVFVTEIKLSQSSIYNSSCPSLRLRFWVGTVFGLTFSCHSLPFIIELARFSTLNWAVPLFASSVDISFVQSINWEKKLLQSKKFALFQENYSFQYCLRYVFLT